ncbi:MAG: hypothetical protein HFE66_08055 [Clostridiales bacterium]|jgi:hypothetical protein|nr:hypothetical protein [Clostridiales bacterium]
MKKINLFLALTLLVFCFFAGLVGCEKTDAPGDATTTPEESIKVTGKLSDIVAAVDEKFSFEKNVSEVIYKADDDGEMMMLLYGVVDIRAADHLIDYVITSPANTHHTFAVFIFDDEMTEDDFTQVRETVSENYMQTRASSLQMYFPEEYATMTWAIENPELVWRQYGNALALIINGDEEPSEAWEAFETAALK